MFFHFSVKRFIITGQWSGHFVMTQLSSKQRDAKSYPIRKLAPTLSVLQIGNLVSRVTKTTK